ncbi:MAG TPA: sugar ABC transporter substrate-binding protein [Solirubrobacteraceae bacterium]
MTSGRMRPAITAAVIALIAAALSGCANGTLKAANVRAPGFGTHAHGTVIVWCRGDTQTAEDEIAARFNATHPHLHVKVVPIPDTEYETKLATAIRGGYVPDVVDGDDINAQLFIYHDAFDNLTPLIDKLPFRDKLAKPMLSLGRHDGRYYSLPFAADISLLYYNKALFKRAGLNPDEPPRTMAQVVSDARRITKLGHGISGYSFGGDSAGLWGFTIAPSAWAEKGYTFVGRTGHQRADIGDNGPLAGTLQALRTMWRDGSAPQSDRTQTGATWGADFDAGTVGIWPGNWVTVQLHQPKFPFGVTELPGPAHGSSAFAGGDSVAIPRGARNPSGAWEYIKFALQPAQQELLPKAGYTPVRTDLLHSPKLAKYPAVLEGMRALRTNAYAPNTIAYETVINEESGPFQAMCMSAVFGSAPVREVLRRAQSQFNTAMAEAQS